MRSSIDAHTQVGVLSDILARASAMRCHAMLTLATELADEARARARARAGSGPGPADGGGDDAGDVWGGVWGVALGKDGDDRRTDGTRERLVSTGSTRGSTRGGAGGGRAAGSTSSSGMAYSSSDRAASATVEVAAAAAAAMHARGLRCLSKVADRCGVRALRGHRTCRTERKEAALACRSVRLQLSLTP